MLGPRFNSETRKRRANLAIMVGHLVVWPIILVIGFGFAGMRFNATPSVPTGIYWVSADPTVAFVEFCPPEPFGRMSVERLYRAKTPLVCADGGEPLLKPIVARAGDSVELSARGIVVNGIPVSNTAPKTVDSAGRPLQAWPFGRYRVAPNTFWVASSYNSRSFDSRYFGPIRKTEIKHHLRPIWTE